MKKTKTKKLTMEQIVKRFVGDLMHFYVPNVGGWPIRVSKDHEELVKLVPSLIIKDDRLRKNPDVEVDPRLMAELYKHLYEESEERYHDLWGKVNDLVNES
jgi:hypothetical protein